MKLFRKTLTANTEEIFNVDSQFVTILNVGDGNLYVNFDKTADTDSLLVPAGMGRSFYFPYKVGNIHVISDGSPVIQIDNLR